MRLHSIDGKCFEETIKLNSITFSFFHSTLDFWDRNESEKTLYYRLECWLWTSLSCVLSVVGINDIRMSGIQCVKTTEHQNIFIARSVNFISAYLKISFHSIKEIFWHKPFRSILIYIMNLEFIFLRFLISLFSKRSRNCINIIDQVCQPLMGYFWQRQLASFSRTDYMHILID